MSIKHNNISLEIPCFNGCNYKQWADKMNGIWLITKGADVINGTLTTPTTGPPSEPTQPDQATATSTQWVGYQALMTRYLGRLDAHKKTEAAYKDANSSARGILSLALDIGIWDQVKDKSAHEAWTWIKEKYAKEQFIKILDNFRFLKDTKIDLSNPNPQLAAFMHHYQRLPIEGSTHVVSKSMASLILLSNLPLATGSVGSTSLYQRMLEDTVRNNTVDKGQIISVMKFSKF